ncbi:protein kinase IKS1, partial [Ascoidea rubescens DSM 1968]
LPSNLFTQNYFEKFFKINKLLGQGANGIVYKVEHFINDFSLGFFALKKIPIGNSSNLKKILNEVELLCILSHSNLNLVKYNHVWLEIDSMSQFGPKIPCAFILTEYCDGGNLEELVNDFINPKLSTNEIKNIIRQKRKLKKINKNKDNLNSFPQIETRLLNYLEILKFFKDTTSGVNQLHKNHIIHRDLKPSNCLLSYKYDFKKFSQLDFNYNSNNKNKCIQFLNSLPTVFISDFGESQFEGNKRTSTGSTGTLEFVAPEFHKKYKNLNEFNKKTDIFGLGMILFFLCFGKLPYSASLFNDEEDQEYSELKSEIIKFNIINFFQSNVFKREYYRRDLPLEIYVLLESLLNYDADKRPLTEDILITID